MTVKDALSEAANELKSVTESYYLEALLLLSFTLNIEKEKVYLKERLELSDTQTQSFIETLNKRLNGYPLPYILKKREFMGLEFFIDEGVLIPRQETEELVETALKECKDKKNFLDIGSGSGVICVSLLYYNTDLRGVALDISYNACEITKINAEKFGVSNRLEIIHKDFNLFTTEKKFDFIVSNPPYVKTEFLKNLPYEPTEALDGGELGFAFYPSLIKKSFDLLNLNGFALFEIDPPISMQVKTEMEKYFSKVSILKDLAKNDRFILGVKK